VVRVFKTKPFARFQRRERINDTSLCAAVAAAEAGLIDADLGGGLIKQRVAREGGGKRGGYRTAIAYRVGARAFFLAGFAKSAQGNIDHDELESLKSQGTTYLHMSDDLIETSIADDVLWEVNCGGKN
jgi:hypothetical protein